MNAESNRNNDIPEMNLDKKYSSKNEVISKNPEKDKKEMEKKKKEIEKLKSFIVKKYSYVKAIGILPPQSIKLFIEEEEVPKESEKYIHLYIILPEDKVKEISKIKQEIVKQIDSTIKSTSQKIWVHVNVPSDIWEICLDSKFELTQAIAMSYPLYDTGFLGALRLAEIHKSLVLQKFERYVVSYVIVGSFFRGDATSISDIDIVVIINDTDVKRMPRLELKERLRSIIAGAHTQEAIALAGVKNSLHVQTYLLTDFWESVKDAHPVMFTFIRDGIPLYDRGTFLPWKALLKMGKLKPTPEAIDMFMKTADRTKEMIERKLLDTMMDVYYGVLNPSQALIMLYGNPPPTHKETPTLMKEIFVDKEKMLNKSDIKILEKIVGLFKEYEHEKLKKISGKEIDNLVKDSEEYMKRLNKLRKQIEKQAQERIIEQIYKDVFELLKSIVGKFSQEKIIQEFEKKFVKKGKFSPHSFRILKNIILARKEFKKGKLSSHKVDEVRKNASILINELIEYGQRCDLAIAEKRRMKIIYKVKNENKTAELLISNEDAFLFKDNNVKIISENGIKNSNMNEVSESMNNKKLDNSIEINPKIFKVLKKELGNFKIII